MMDMEKQPENSSRIFDISTKFRLPYNIQSTVTIGMFDYNTYGADLNLFYPFKDERFL